MVLASGLVACAAAPERVQVPGRAGSTLETELARFGKADEQYARAQWGDAAQAYANLATSFPRNAFVWFRLGNCHTRLNQLDQAAQAYRNAQLLDPRDGRFTYNLGLVRKAQARAAFEEAQAHLPNNEALRSDAQQQSRLMASVPQVQAQDGQ